MAYIYVVSCADGSLYTGITKDIKRRMKEHMSGNAKSKYTRSRKIKALEALWECDGYSEAARFEYAIKQLTRAQKLALISEPEMLDGYFKELSEIAVRNLEVFDIQKEGK